jgi:hypothetical protein
MGIIGDFFGGRAVTSAGLLAEISNAESELAALNAQLAGLFAGLATMTDDAHVRAETQAASLKRAIARLEARIPGLHTELPEVQQAEQIAAKAAADEALRKRAEAARKAVNVEAAKLLAQYDQLGEQVADIQRKLLAIGTEIESVNRELQANPVAEQIPSVERVHRKHPDRAPAERRETRPMWVYKDPFTKEEVVTTATLKEDGTPPFVPPVHIGGVTVYPHIELREVVVSRSAHRAGAYLPSLSGVRLPPGLLKSKWHWPRES